MFRIVFWLLAGMLFLGIIRIVMFAVGVVLIFALAASSRDVDWIQFTYGIIDGSMK